MTFAANIIKQRPELVYLVTGIDAGRNAWYYVRVNKVSVESFLHSLNDAQIHLLDYGEILYSGFGIEPPADVKQKISEFYDRDVL